MLNKKAFSSLFHCSTQKRRFYIFSERRRTTPEPVLLISGMKMIEAAGSLFPGRFCFFRAHWPETSGKHQEEPPRPRNRKSTDEGQRPEESFPSPDAENVVSRFIWTRPKHGTNIRTISYPFRSCFYDRKQWQGVHVVAHPAQNYLIINALVPTGGTNK